MKKNKIIFKLDSNRRGKFYVGRKWLKDVTSVDIYARPHEYAVYVEQYKRDSSGRFVVASGEIERKRTEYHFGGL